MTCSFIHVDNQLVICKVTLELLSFPIFLIYQQHFFNKTLLGTYLVQSKQRAGKDMTYILWWNEKDWDEHPMCAPTSFSITSFASGSKGRWPLLREGSFHFFWLVCWFLAAVICSWTVQLHCITVTVISQYIVTNNSAKLQVLKGRTQKKKERLDLNFWIVFNPLFIYFSNYKIKLSKAWNYIQCIYTPGIMLYKHAAETVLYWTPTHVRNSQRTRLAFPTRPQNRQLNSLLKVKLTLRPIIMG